MTSENHQRLLGSLLAVFALLNIGICVAMLLVIPFDEFEGGFGPGLVWLIRGAVVASICLFLFQLFAGYKVIRSGTNARGWGIAGSVIAILGGYGLPVGIYGLWVNTARPSESGVISDGNK